jgi:hypothetical protein
MSEKLRSNENQLNSEQVFDASRGFLQHFGVGIDPKKNPKEFKEALAQLDPRYKGGRDLVRWQLESDQTEWDEKTKDTIMQTAESLRMFEAETPLVGHFDAVLVMAGARQSNVDRTMYALRCAYDKADFQSMGVVGSTRKLNSGEKSNVANYALGAETEKDLIIAAVRLIEDENNRLADENHLHGPNVRYWGWEILDQEKAGTPDVLRYVFDGMVKQRVVKEGIESGDFRVGAVTTQIYQVSTGLDLARIAKEFGIKDTFAAGCPSDPNAVARRTPATYISEILRTLRAAANYSAETIEE